MKFKLKKKGPPEKKAAPKKKRSVPRRAVNKPGSPKIRARLPSMWQRGLAGVEVQRTVGPGQKALDELCHARGWRWAVVSTSHEKDDKEYITTHVIVGELFSGTAERLDPYDPAKAWDVHDEALMAVAEQLEGHGAEG